MKRWRAKGVPLPAIRMASVTGNRGGAWSRTAKLHKAVHLQCKLCGSMDRLETDHIVPRHLGGSDAWSNLQTLCAACHSRKSAGEAGER